MGFHRSSHRIDAARRWQRFVERNARVIAAAGLPSAVTARIGNWDDFLVHGSLVGDPDGFDIGGLTPEQYDSLVTLATSYFAAGYEFFAPAALHPEDQERLRARFLR